MPSIRFPVSETKQKDLEDRLARLGIREEDLTEQFVHGSGAGGQKINKTSVAVRLTHPKSGLSVHCLSTRSQSMNRYFARKLLAEKAEEILFAKKSEARQKVEKIRRQKRKRSKRAKDKMLESKKHQSEKKQYRKKIIKE
jgi:protein subunit release factor B